MKKAEVLETQIEKLKRELQAAKKAEAAQKKEEEAKRIAAMERAVLRAAKRSGLLKSGLTSRELEDAFRKLVSSDGGAGKPQNEVPSAQPPFSSVAQNY